MAKRLVSSKLIAAMAATLPAIVASAQVVVYNDQAGFESGATGAGLGLSYTEDCEGFQIDGGYAMMPSPWTGLGDGSLSMASSANDFIFLVKGSYYFPSVPTNAAGTLEGRTTTLAFDGGAPAVGFDIYGTDTFTAGYYTDIDYTVYDLAGMVLATGQFNGVDGSVGTYFGAVSTALIGSVDITASRFGGAAADYEDNIQVWAVPAPSSLALLGLGVLCVRRRR